MSKLFKESDYKDSPNGTFQKFKDKPHQSWSRTGGIKPASSKVKIKLKKHYL